MEEIYMYAAADAYNSMKHSLRGIKVAARFIPLVP